MKCPNKIKDSVRRSYSVDQIDYLFIRFNFSIFYIFVMEHTTILLLYFYTIGEHEREKKKMVSIYYNRLSITPRGRPCIYCLHFFTLSDPITMRDFKQFKNLLCHKPRPWGCLIEINRIINE